MGDAVQVICQNQYDPHQAVIMVAGVYVGAFPLRDYDRIKGPLGLPDFPCTETQTGE